MTTEKQLAWFDYRKEYGSWPEPELSQAHKHFTAGYEAGHASTRRIITTPEELDKMPLQAIVALISHSRNVPMTIVFHRGSNEFGGDGWCTPEARGQIPSEAVFEFIGLNGFPPELTVLHDGRTA